MKTTEAIEMLDDFSACLQDERRTYPIHDPEFDRLTYMIGTVNITKEHIWENPEMDFGTLVNLYSEEVWGYLQKSKTDVERDMYTSMLEALDLIFATLCEVYF